MYQKEKAVCHATQAELEQVREDNKKLCEAMMKLRRKDWYSPRRIVFELEYDRALYHQEARDIARIVFDGLMREDLRRRGQKE